MARQWMTEANPAEPLVGQVGDRGEVLPERFAQGMAPQQDGTDPDGPGATYEIERTQGSGVGEAECHREGGGRPLVAYHTRELIKAELFRIVQIEEENGATGEALSRPLKRCDR